jgi:hypothetical protein
MTVGWVHQSFSRLVLAGATRAAATARGLAGRGQLHRRGRRPKMGAPLEDVTVRRGKAGRAQVCVVVRRLLDLTGQDCLSDLAVPVRPAMSVGSPS